MVIHLIGAAHGANAATWSDLVPFRAIPYRGRMRRPLRAAACGLLVVTLVGCGSGGGDAGPTSSTGAPPIETSTPTTTTTTGVAEASTVGTATPTSDRSGIDPALNATVQGFWRVWLEANNPPNDNHPGLSQFSTGVAYDSVIDAIRQNKAQGSIISLPPDSKWTHQVYGYWSRSDGSWRLSDCAVDDSVKRDVATGSVIDDRVMTYLMDVIVVRDSDDVWKVSSYTILNEWEGGVNCVTAPQK